MKRKIWIGILVSSGMGIVSFQNCGGFTDKAVLGQTQSLARLPTGTVTGYLSLLAGHYGIGSGYLDAGALNASFFYPSGVAVDSGGNIYVADTWNNAIRKVSASGVVSTLAGSPNAFTVVGSCSDGPGELASFASPQALRVDTQGNIFVADSGCNAIRMITPNGMVTTLPGITNTLNNPLGIVMDSNGNIYVSDSGNNAIRKIDSSGLVTTVAGTVGAAGSSDGNGIAASFNNPSGIALDSAGNIYVADSGNNTIRKIDSSGAVTTLAGMPGNRGTADGTGATAAFYNPLGLFLDSGGNIYVADSYNSTIRKVSSSGTVITVAGSVIVTGSTDGSGAVASFNNVQGVAADLNGNIYVVDKANQLIRKITSSGVVTTLAGTVGTGGFADGSGTTAYFYNPQGVAVDSSGNIYVTDTGNNTIRKISFGGVVTTFAGTHGVQGSSDGTGAAASFNKPTGIAVDANGNVYVSDNGSCLIRKITPSGVVTTIAGTGSVGSLDGVGTGASFNNPKGVAVDVQGNVYIADYGNQSIRQITPGGLVTTLPTKNTSFSCPIGVTTDPTGNVYAADSCNDVIWEISSSGVVSVIVGTLGQYGVIPGSLPASLAAPAGLTLVNSVLYLTVANAVMRVE